MNTIEDKYEHIEDNTPNKIWVCHCEQCSHIKNKRKNRKLKKSLKKKRSKT